MSESKGQQVNMGEEIEKSLIYNLTRDARADNVRLLNAALRRAKAEAKEYAWDEAAMRAACAAHRACCGVEADNAQGKIHGCCVVCGVPWPCKTAQFFLFKADARAAQIEEGE